MMNNKLWTRRWQKLLWIIPLVFAGIDLDAQMLADFESPEKTPPFYGDSSAVVPNPDKSGINTSDSVGYYRKVADNWHWVSLQFPDTMKVRYNNTLTFKLRTSTQGRIFAKFWIGSEVMIENWCPEWNFRPSPNVWTECTMDMTPAMGKGFTLLQLAACVDNTAEADVWFDDVRLSNPEAGDGSPKVFFSMSAGKALTGKEITFDASASYDYDGDIVDYHWDFGDGTTGSGKTVNHVFERDSLFFPTLTITDNEDKSASLSSHIFIIPSGGKISSPHILTPAPETNRKIEAVFEINGSYANVYDPDEVMVDAVVTYPDGDTSQVPCFYYVKVDYKNGQWVEDPGFQSWMLRFSSPQAGTHSLKLTIRDGDGYSEAGPWTIIVAPGESRGIIRADTLNRQYFRHSTGEPFYPLGINIGWNGIGNYATIINNLSRGNANVFRYWLTPFAGQALEWKSGYYIDYGGLGRYRQESAAMGDSLLELCEARDVYMQMVLFQHGEFSENVDAMWETNPYNSVNGGYVDRAEEYFYNDDCMAQAKKLLRYIVARWAWSKNLFAWEFFNEVQFTGIHNSQSSKWFPGVLNWHSEMGRYIGSIDPFDHLQTTSASTQQLSQLDNLAVLDNLQYHLYESETSMLNLQADLDYRFRGELQHASVINGEYGRSGDADLSMDTQRNAIWNGIMTQVPRYMWVWENYLQQSWADLFAMPAQYLSDEDFSGEEGLADYAVVQSHPTLDLKSHGLSTGTKYYGYIYDPANGTNIKGTTIRIDDLPLANYDVTWYLPYSGQVIRQDSIVPYFTSNTLELPVFSKSIAFKLKYRSEYTAPIARAGNDTLIALGGTARLSGASSSALDSVPLTFLWHLRERPDTSEFALSDSTGVAFEISPDVAGMYSFSLTVNDGRLPSLPDKVSVRVSAPPVADAGRDTTVDMSETYLRISGDGSYDPDGDEITFQWTLLSAPPGSDNQLIGGEESGLTTLVVDAEGVYRIGLRVHDGIQSSLPDTMEVTVINAAGLGGFLTDKDLRVYPNPALSRLYIANPGQQAIGAVEVFDVRGRMLLKAQPDEVSPGTYEVSFDGSVSGPQMVLLRITRAGRQAYRKLILLE
jgi:hypothetical protein